MILPPLPQQLDASSPIPDMRIVSYCFSFVGQFHVAHLTKLSRRERRERALELRREFVGSGFMVVVSELSSVGNYSVVARLMADPVLRMRALSLYRSLMRSCRTWPGPPKEKHFIYEEASALFEKHRHLSDPEEIAKKIDEGEKRYQMAWRVGNNFL